MGQYQPCCHKHEGNGTGILKGHTEWPFQQWKLEKEIALGNSFSLYSLPRNELIYHLEGCTLLCKLIAAVKGRAGHHEALQELEGSIEAMVEGRTELEKWMCEAEAWKADKSKPNPLESKVTCVCSSGRQILGD